LKKSNFTYQVYRLVKKIPKGDVLTYGKIAQKLGRPKAARAVGNILHNNPFKDVPCHRVVNKEGKLALNYGSGGIKEQRRRLLKEKVKFKNKYQVKLG